jgi:hypothetical protein
MPSQALETLLDADWDEDVQLLKNVRRVWRIGDNF